MNYLTYNEALAELEKLDKSTVTLEQIEDIVSRVIYRSVRE